MREMVEYGFTAFNGKVWNSLSVDSYNAMQSRINAFIQDGREVPESMLNASHHLFATFSGLV